jgi:cytoskeletal protein CcmA (bactofilin family)
MSTVNRTALSSSFNTNLPDNNTGLITPEVLRKELIDIIDSAIFPEDSGSRYIDTASFHNFTSSKVDTLTVVTGSYAVTASNAFIGSQTITGSLTVTGSLILSSSIHTIIGNITSSGNISASGDIIANSFTGNISPSNITQPFTNITASGNISASGDVLGNTGSFSHTTTDTLSATTIVNVNTTHVTASGNISASGEIEANKFVSNGVDVAQFAAGAVQLGGGILQPTALSGTGITLGITGQNQPVTIISALTASSNISGSASSTGSVGSLRVTGASIDFTNLPTSDPGVAGRLYRDGAVVKVSL